MTIALMILVEPIQSLIPMSETFYELMNNMLKPTLFNFFTIVIAAPILVEIVFRGIILEGFLKNYSPWKAILWSSLLFGAVHLNPWQAVTAISLSMLMGWLYYKTDSIIPGIIIHFSNNLLSFLLSLFVSKDIESIYQLINSPTIYLALCVLSAVILYAGFTYFKKIDSSE
ncbi:MAG: CPBP family intramembrane metalloprotease [Bacteroidales bacterium]|nr:CPBP family intramembrane metalloprotease [Bacteroidales bacterium]